MQNGFGFKDFMLLAMLLVLIIMTGMQMYQEDRRFRDVLELRSAVQEQATQTGALRRAIQDGGVRTSARPGPGQQAAATRDESWARAGDVAISWQDGPAFVSDPRDFEDFGEGGELRETFEGRPAKITPYQYSDVYGRRVIENVVCECLGRYNSQTLSLEGVLAEAWQFDPEGMWLRVKIRDEACFSDGIPLTAEDVKFTFDYVMDPQMDTERFRSTLNVIQSVEVVSEKVCEFRFERPVYTNMSSALTMPVIPQHLYQGLTPAQFNSATGYLAGSGPYRLESLDINNQWAPPEDIVLVRNENYWGVRQGPDVIRFRIIQNYTTSLTDFQNGGSHMMRATSEQFREMSEDEGFVERNQMLAWSNMRGGYSFIVWNCAERNGRATPFADGRVRMAMTLMLDRERINRDFYMGLAEVATGPFPPGPQQNPEIEPWPYNEDRARQLLAEAGWLDRNNNGILENARGDEFRWEYTFSTGSPTTEKIGNYMVDQCRKLGIVCTIRKVDWSIMDSILDNRDFDGLTMAWSASDPESDPNQLWHSDSIRNRGDNFAQWNSPEADRLIQLGRGTMDVEERMRIWHDLHRVIHEEQPYTFLLEIPWIRFVDRHVENVHTYPVGLAKEEWYFPGGSETPMSGG
ncbi:MAG: hypothetical protein KDA05_08335 [Phycisphaerales bacterium]|nr:hypothetical protein [Phycisphaerales bacterium]